MKMFGISEEKLWAMETKITNDQFWKNIELKHQIDELEERIEVLEKKIGAEFCPHCGKVVEFKEKK